MLPGVILYLFGTLIQIQNMRLAANFAASNAVVGQLEILALALFACVPFVLTSGNKWLGRLSSLLLLLLMAFYAASASFFRIVRDQFNFPYLEDFIAADFSSYGQSYLADMQPADLLNMALIALAAVLAFGALRKIQPVANPRILALCLLGLAAGLFAAGAVLSSRVIASAERYDLVASRPVFSVMWQNGSTDGSALGRLEMTREQLFAVRHATPQTLGDELAKLRRNQEILQAKTRNVVFVILESVGSKQLLKDGIPDAQIAPFLHSQSANAMVFDRLYNTFPASTRSHIALATGGSTLTWGSVAELKFPYAAQTMVSAFKKAGMDTGLFSAGGFDFENLSNFYDGLGFGHTFNPDRENNRKWDRFRVHAWGLDERVIAEKALAWIREKPNGAFLQFMTTTTHFPYGAPKDFVSPFEGDGAIEKYRKSIYFTDSVLASIAEGLGKAGLADQTVLVLVGDHGEAFGDLHKGNYLHRNYLYEENIRNFLMIIDLGKRIQPVASSRIASIGDVMPTVLELRGITPASDVLGQSLFAENYEPRIHYFHNSTSPARWGLVDGNWKYIAEQDGSKNPELYDMGADPNEAVNLAASHPEKIAVYSQLAKNWFVFANNEFALKLDGFLSDADKLAFGNAMTVVGPNDIRIGIRLPGTPFQLSKGPFNPAEAITVMTRGAPLGKDTPLRYVYSSPSGAKRERIFTHKAGWTSTYFAEPLDAPREPGTWRVDIFDGERKLLGAGYQIRDAAPLFWSKLDKNPGVRNIVIGSMGEDGYLHEQHEMRPDGKPAALLQMVPFDSRRGAEFEWISPGGRRHPVAASIAKRSSHFVGRYDGKFPLEEGKWTLKVWIGQMLEGEADFNVSASAPAEKRAHGTSNPFGQVATGNAQAANRGMMRE